MNSLQAVNSIATTSKAFDLDCGVANAMSLEREIEWFSQILDLRIKLYFQQESELTSLSQLAAPDLSSDQSLYAKWVKQHLHQDQERIVLLMALIPHIRPQVFDTFLFVIVILIVLILNLVVNKGKHTVVFTYM